MAVSLESEPAPGSCSPDAPRTRARARTRARLNPFAGGLLPTGSPFGWNACDRSLYVQFLTALLMLIVAFSFAALDGWPFLLQRPDDEVALRTTTNLAIAALLFWLGFYAWTRRFCVRRGSKNSRLLLATIAAHIVTGTAVCYALGPVYSGQRLDHRGRAAFGNGASRAPLALDSRRGLAAVDVLDAPGEQGWPASVLVVVRGLVRATGDREGRRGARRRRGAHLHSARGRHGSPDPRLARGRAVCFPTRRNSTR